VNYFQQIITFTQAVSIRIQILFGKDLKKKKRKRIIIFFYFKASMYYDYINENNYQLNGFLIDSDEFFSLSSISVNNSTLK
jgi:hypothetical protein